MLFSLVSLVLIVLTSLFCVGLVGLSQNIRLSVRVLFSLAIIFLNGWMVLLYLSNLPSPWVVEANRAVYVSPLIGLFFMGQFADAYYKKMSARHLSLLGIISVATVIPGVIIASTSANVIGVTPRLTGGELTGYSIIPGHLSGLVAIATFILSATLILRLFLAYTTAKQDIKRPLKVILQTLSLAIIVSLSTNIVLPLVTGGSSLANALSSLAATIFIVSVAYSVLRYSFLDVRLLIVRYVGYIAGLGLVLLFVSTIQSALFNLSGIDTEALAIKQRVALVLLFVFAAVSFTPLRQLFARVTTNIFFKDEYDSSKFISTFNANLVKHISLESLLSTSATDIDQVLKPTFCVVGVGKTNSTPQYLVGTDHMNEQAGRQLMELVERSTEQVLVKQLSGQSSGDEQLITIPRTSNVELLVKLTESIRNKDSLLGFVAIGPKKNGEIYNKTDIEVLRIVANELELAVQNALRFEQIQQFNVTLQEEVDAATRKLKKQNKRLEELDNIKDDFISMASHQLRTPLTSVKGYVSMVLEGDAGKLTPMQSQMLKQAFASSQRMVFLITDLLNVSRLKTGKFIIDAAPADLSEVIEQELQQLHETAGAKNITISYDHPKTFPQLMLDETKIRQVIMNFVDNAIYYTPVGGKINVVLEDKPSSVELRVTDNGIGVPRSEQHHLFTKFYRATNARKARPDGTGLGLFMAQKVIIAQGGSVIFTSKEGQGSTFGFSFSKSKLKVPDQSEKPQESTPLAVH